MQVHELEVLLEALKDSGYGGCEVFITYEAKCRGKIDVITLDLEKRSLFIGE